MSPLEIGSWLRADSCHLYKGSSTNKLAIGAQKREPNRRKILQRLMPGLRTSPVRFQAHQYVNLRRLLPHVLRNPTIEQRAAKFSGLWIRARAGAPAFASGARKTRLRQLSS